MEGPSIICIQGTQAVMKLTGDNRARSLAAFRQQGVGEPLCAVKW
jgi:hypothetical protein